MEKSKNQITKRTEAEILDIAKIRNEFKTYEKSYKTQYSKLQDDIIKELLKSKKDNHTVESGDKKVRIKLVTPSKVDWDVEKLKSILPKDVQNYVIEKRYSINDMEGLIDYLKSCGVNPKKFKTFVDTQEIVNHSMIEGLSEQKIVTQEQLEKCCTVVEGASYLKITEQETSSNAKDS